MNFKYYLPNLQNGINDKIGIELETSTNSIIIIGPNGSGKSKLGAWMEKIHPEIHRISSQRNINFSANIPQKSYEEASYLFKYNVSPHQQDENHVKQKIFKFHNDIERTTWLENDYDNVLAALFAKENNEESKYFYQCRECEKNGQNIPHTPKTIKDELLDVWNSIFPQREIDFKDSHVYAKTEEDAYIANQMSDGERSALYLIAQVLSISDSNTIIIDEPEIHLHRSITNRMWSKLEEVRDDFLFIYITHDTNFAADHYSSDKIWVKSFDATKWEYEKLEPHEDIPEDLLFEILGNR